MIVEGNGRLMEKSVQELLSELAQRCLVASGETKHERTTRSNKNRTSTRIKRLMKIAYNILLFHNNSGNKSNRMVPYSPIVDGSLNSFLSEKDCLLAHAYLLRCCRHSDEAEQLEAHVTRLTQIYPIIPDNIKAILRLLLFLRSMEYVTLEEDVCFNNYSSSNTFSKVNHPHLHLAPLNYGDIPKPCKLDFSFYYTHFPSGLFEVKLFNHENKLYKFAEPKVFETIPGSYANGQVLFTSCNAANKNGYVSSTAHKLFGALVHHLDDPWNVGVKLEIPELGDTSPSMSFSSKTYSSASSKSQTSEDEGYVEIETPTSNGPSPTFENLDVWETALTSKRKTHFVWESIGFSVTQKEKMFFSESGAKAMDELVQLMQYELSLLDQTVNFQPGWKISTNELMRDIKYLLLGIPSTCFPFSNTKAHFTIAKGLEVSGLSPLSLNNILQEYILDGTLYWRLCKFTSNPSTNTIDHKGLVFNAFIHAVYQYLQYYHASILSATPCDTLLQMGTCTRYVRSQLRQLGEMCCIDPTLPYHLNQDCLLTGIRLISRLYSCALESVGSDLYPVLLYLLQTSCLPFFRFLHQWIYSGICVDEFNEFLILPNHEYLLHRDYLYWTKGFALTTSSTSLPSFLKETIPLIFLCGKSLSLLKLCCPQHHLCTSQDNIPFLSLTFSEIELNNIKTQTIEYVASMERIAVAHKRSHKQLMEQAEAEKVLRKEQAYKEATANLQRAQKRLEDERKELHTRKRQQMAQLQEQIEIVRVRRKSEREQQEADEKAWEEKERVKAATSEEAIRNFERQQSQNSCQISMQQMKGDCQAEVQTNLNDSITSLQTEKSDDQMLLSPDQASLMEVKMQITPDLTPSSETPGTFSQFSEDAMSLSVTTVEDAFTPSEGTDVHIELTEILNNVANLIMCTSDPDNDHFLQDPNANVINDNYNSEMTRSTEITTNMTSTTTTTAAATTIDTSSTISVTNNVENNFSNPLPMAVGYNDNYHVTGAKQKYNMNNSNCENWMERKNSRTARLSEKSQVKNNVFPPVPIISTVDNESEHLTVNSKNVINEEFVDNLIIRSSPSPSDKLKGSETEESSKTPDSVELALLDVGVLLKSRGRSDYGHASDNTIKNILYETHPNPLNVDDNSSTRTNTPEPFYTDISVSDSALIEHRTFAVLKSRGRNIHGHASDSTIQKIIYGEKEESLSVSRPESRTTMLTGLRFSSPTNHAYDQDFEFTNLDLNIAKKRISADENEKNENKNQIFVTSSLPLPVLIERSLLLPLEAQVNLVNQSLIDFYLVDLKIIDHFKVLRAFILLHDGEFAQSLADQFFEKIALGVSPVKLMNPKNLNAILSRAVTASAYSDSAFVSNLSFSVNSIPAAFSTNVAAPFHGLEIQYRTEWPLNIVITPKCLALYNRIFYFFMQIRHLHWALTDIFYHLKRNIKYKKTTQSPHFIQMQLFRHQMHHFVRVLQDYVSHQLYQVSWSELKHDINHNVRNLDDLCRVHMKYLKRSIARCLLSPKATPLMTLMRNVFVTILEFHAQMTMSPWQENPNTGEVEHPAYWRLLSSYNLFKERSQFLFTAIETCVSQGFHRCLQDFLMSWNFNGISI